GVRLRVTAPAAYAVGGREVMARLEGRGTRIELSVDAGGEAVLVDPMWTSAASMLAARGYQTETLLQDGSVLVAAGYYNGNNIASAERYDPIANTWTSAGSLLTARSRHTATLLP